MAGYSRDSFYRFKEFYERRRRIDPAAGVEEPRAAGDRGDPRGLTVSPAGRDAQSLWNITAGCLTRA
jgi:hypothetical protein